MCICISVMHNHRCLTFARINGIILLTQGELSERFKEPVLKTGDSERNLGFESLTLRQTKSPPPLGWTFSHFFLYLYRAVAVVAKAATSAKKVVEPIRAVYTAQMDILASKNFRVVCSLAAKMEKVRIAAPIMGSSSSRFA